MSISPFNWIRDALGVRKDWLDAQKIQLEIEKLRAENSLIAKPTDADIERYDKNVAELLKRPNNTLGSSLINHNEDSYWLAIHSLIFLFLKDIIKKEATTLGQSSHIEEKPSSED